MAEKNDTENNFSNKNNCRFDYLQPLNEMGTCMKMREYISGCDGSGPEFTYELSMNSLHNNRWLHSHMYGLIQIWLANMDFQLVVDINKVVNYMTKYLCKPKIIMSKGLSNMVQKMINVGHHTGLGLRVIFKK